MVHTFTYTHTLVSYNLWYVSCICILRELKLSRYSLKTNWREAIYDSLILNKNYFDVL